MLSIIDRDKIISFQNKTFVQERETLQYAKRIVREKKVSITCALRELVNWAIDKKLKLEAVRYKRDGLPINIITNFEELLKNEDIKERAW